MLSFFLIVVVLFLVLLLRLLLCLLAFPVFGIITDRGPSGRKACARLFGACSDCSVPAMPIFVPCQGVFGQSW
jgi:hypothetical protein